MKPTPTVERLADKRAALEWQVAAVFALIVTGVAAYFVFGMPGMDQDISSNGDSVAERHGAATAMRSSDFARRMESSPAAVVISADGPGGGRLARTDLVIPNDRIVRDERLPADRSTPILLYCKTGRMSRKAAAALVRAGYTDVNYLKGGLDAWRAAGRPIF